MLEDEEEMRVIIGLAAWPFIIGSVLLMKAVGFVVVPLFLAVGRLPPWPWCNDEDGPDGPEWFAKEYKNKFWRRFVWLAWRNGAHNYGLHTVGVKSMSVKKVWTVGNEKISDLSGVAGINVRFGNCEGFPFGIWMIYWILQTNGDHCLRVLIGWKMFNVGVKEIIGPVFSVSPWKRFGGGEGI